MMNKAVVSAWCAKLTWLEWNNRAKCIAPLRKFPSRLEPLLLLRESSSRQASREVNRRTAHLLRASSCTGPTDYRDWGVKVVTASTLADTLSRELQHALLFGTLATLRTDIKLFEAVDQLQWKGPTIESIAHRLDAAQVRHPPVTPAGPSWQTSSRQRLLHGIGSVLRHSFPLRSERLAWVYAPFVRC